MTVNSSLRKVALNLARVTFALVAMMTIAGLFGRTSKYFELLSHFRIQYLLAAALCAVTLAGLRAKWWATASLLYTVAVGALLLPLYVTPTALVPQAATRNVRVLLANVNYGNTQYADFITFVERENPDIVIVQEVSTRWRKALEALGAHYPFSESSTEDHDGSGMALFSRLSFERSGVVFVGSDDRPSIHATIRVGNKSLSLFTFHPRAPLRSGHFEFRNRQLEASANYVRGLPEPKVLVGDLNITPWSPYFDGLLSASGLVDARVGFGVLPTWPVVNRIAPLMLPIDQCFISPDILVANMRTGPTIGSDHLPLVIDLVIPDGDLPASASVR
jgi:endonuclease/exonuclease/phosphatase (EEP) superfamily protein YafD